jgi:hypothetical protein
MGTRLIGTSIDAMVVLVGTRLIQCVSVRPIGQCGTFVPNRFVQHFTHRFMDFAPLVRFDTIARQFRMSPGDVQDFGGIQVSDACDRRLIQQGHLDHPPTSRQPRP